METLFIVVISSGDRLNSEAVFSTASAKDALLAVRAIVEVADSVNAAIYDSDLKRGVLRVRNGRWTMPLSKVTEAAA